MCEKTTKKEMVAAVERGSVSGVCYRCGTGSVGGCDRNGASSPSLCSKATFLSSQKLHLQHHTDNKTTSDVPLKNMFTHLEKDLRIPTLEEEREFFQCT